ncbi:MAG: hypothetical protein CMF40_02705 [Legionellales bacterium]|nr:hypothetical protein [Legionellales bacterium]
MYKLLLATRHFLAIFIALWLSLPALAETNTETAAPPGQFISLETNKIHLHCVGEGSPIIVFDSGVGGSHLDWINVQSRAGELTQACSYDRSGYGWSEMGIKPRTSDRIVSELIKILKIAKKEPPYILVGHSFGGLNMQYFARTNPKDVMGLILIDSIHAEQYKRFEDAGIEIPTMNTTRFLLGSKDQVTEGMPTKYKDIAYELVRSDEAVSSMFNELRNMHISTEETLNAAKMPDIPLSVITHGKQIWDNPMFINMEEIWLELQTKLSRSTPKGRLLIANGSGHHIHLEQPELILSEIRSIIGKK